MGKPLSWKWKLAIASIVLVIVGIGFIFSPWGLNTMTNWLNTAYNETPPDQRRDHEAAKWWLRLAWFEGTICMRRKEASKLYEEFLGILPDEKKGVDFMTYYRQTGRPNWNGKFDPKERTGWGIMHEDAPRAFFQYIELNAAWGSKLSNADLARGYYYLFYKLYPYYAKTRNPHPKFYVYWDIMRDRYIVKDRRGVPQVREKPPEFAGPEER